MHYSAFLPALVPLASAWTVTLSDHSDCSGTRHSASGGRTANCVTPSGSGGNFDAKAVEITLTSRNDLSCQFFVYTDLNGACARTGSNVWTGYNKGVTGCQT